MKRLFIGAALVSALVVASEVKNVQADSHKPVISQGDSFILSQSDDVTIPWKTVISREWSGRTDIVLVLFFLYGAREELPGKLWILSGKPVKSHLSFDRCYEDRPCRTHTYRWQTEPFCRYDVYVPLFQDNGQEEFHPRYPCIVLCIFSLCGSVCIPHNVV